MRAFPAPPLLNQISSFFGVGLAASIADYGTRFVALNMLGLRPTFAALTGYLVGGVLSYWLNRAHTFATRRSHAEAGWRFTVVMAVGFSLTYFFVWLFTDGLGLPKSNWRDYGAFLVTTGIVFCWNFVAHKLWTFADRPA
jgi:putative flippase GtrA